MSPTQLVNGAVRMHHSDQFMLNCVLQCLSSVTCLKQHSVDMVEKCVLAIGNCLFKSHKTHGTPRARTSTAPPNATHSHAARHRQRDHRTPEPTQTLGTPRARTSTAPPNATHSHAARHRQRHHRTPEPMETHGTPRARTNTSPPNATHLHAFSGI